MSVWQPRRQRETLLRKKTRHLRRDVFRRGDDRLGDSAPDARRSDKDLTRTNSNQGSSDLRPAIRAVRQGVQDRYPSLEAVLLLLGFALSRRSRSQHHALPDEGDYDHLPLGSLHSRAVNPRHLAQLVCGQQGRRDGGTKEGARQYGASRLIRAHRDSLPVVRDGLSLGAGLHLEGFPREPRLRRDADAGVASSSTFSTTGSCPSCRSF
jgi:hypothetical protein